MHTRRCLLLSPEQLDRVVVVEARITETDPTARCHGQRIGRMCYRVQIDLVMPGCDELPTPIEHEECPTLGASLHTHILWPRSHIELIGGISFSNYIFSYFLSRFNIIFFHIEN
jgi:hypothetical protein